MLHCTAPNNRGETGWKWLSAAGVLFRENGHGAAQCTMAESLALVRRVNTCIGEIHSASSEQLTGISQVNAAVAQLDLITQQNAALVQHNAALAQDLQVQAQTMAEAVRVFRLDAVAPAPQADAVALRRAMKGQPPAPDAALATHTIDHPVASGLQLG